MQISRRDLIRSSAAAGAAVTLGGIGLADSAVAGSRATAVRTTTLTSVLAKGPAGAGGWRPVVRQAGEKHLVRTGLGASARKGRSNRRKALGAFAQLSDVHIIDAQSPIRLEYGESISSSAYRPQELLSGHVADAMVQEINKTRRGPVTGRKLDFAIQTGDNSDTAQYNELRWNIDILDGRSVRIDSGDLTRYEGVMDQELDSYNTNYWHPEGTPDGKDDDIATEHGFTPMPGLLDAARKPFKAAGLSMPWYATMGNHDGLVQGNFPISATFNARAIGDKKQLSSSSADTRTVTADPKRRLLDRSDWVDEHFRSPSTPGPKGHGFTAENRAKNTAYYYFDKGVIRHVVLDTVATFGDEGALDDRQFAWLKKLIDQSKNKLVILYSHHPLQSFSDDALADEIEAELVKRPQVIAWVNGHTHTNQIWAHPRTQKGKVTGGFWEINTASHIDWPQQARLLEVADNRDGSISIFTTMIDHSGAVTPQLSSTAPTQLAGVSRLLAANDWQERDNNRRGARTARNVELVLPAPKFLRPKKPKK